MRLRSRGQWAISSRGAAERFAQAAIPIKGDRKSSHFRIRRDARFSKNKNPFKTNAGVVLTRSGRRATQGSLFSPAPAQCFFAAGFYRPEPAQLAKLRAAAARARKPFKQMIANLAEALKCAPRGFEEVEDPEILADIRQKHFICLRPVLEKRIHEPRLAEDFCVFASDSQPLLKWGWEALMDCATIFSMAKLLPCIDEACREFIARQKIFFAASAANGAHINLSPRGTDLFAVIDDLTVAYLDRTGSGNETAAHLKADGRLTLMFCAFDGPPNILRLYGRGEVLRRGSGPYRAMLESAFGRAEPAGARQIIVLGVDRVQTSCGYGTPLFDYRGERPSLDNWARSLGEDGLLAYRHEKNLVSIDGLPTGLLE